MYNSEKWQKAVAFHGHECPGLAIGFKACQAVDEHISTLISLDEEIACVTENDTCAVDAVQSLLGCTFGKGNLIYRPFGKMAFSFYYRNSGETLRIYFKAENRDMSREEWMRYILNAPTDELFSFGTPDAPLPERARLFNSLACCECGEKAREDRIRLRDNKPVCLSCFKEYDR